MLDVKSHALMKRYDTKMALSKPLGYIPLSEGATLDSYRHPQIVVLLGGNKYVATRRSILLWDYLFLNFKGRPYTKRDKERKGDHPVHRGLDD